MTDSANISSNAGVLPHGRFAGRSDFGDLIREGFRVAALQGFREIIICDTDFDDWPLGERLVIDALGAWSRSGRKFTMLARNYGVVTRKHARFVTWRRTWAHLVECRASGSGPNEVLPSAMWTPNWVFERLDLERSAGISGDEPARRVALKERLNERLLKSVPAFPATTLGL
jgi:hypothetical protein